uniref:Cathepsin B5 n=1 Tax=Mahanarva fimbriolata TaxID=672148 RepID=A0A7U3RVS5_9HEMI|nr:cathepsin B5 [Mahanarva fimbriolata]
MKCAILLWCLSVACSKGFNVFESDDIISTVNNAQTTWTAGHNFHHVSKEYIKRLLGHRKREGKSVLPLKTSLDTSGEAIPASFDARDKWPNCEALRTVRDQGDCGSCWAVAAAATLTDRFCIATNGSFNSYLSPEDVLSCCTSCGDGCDGGFDDQAWLYFNKVGIVTGGHYGSKIGCQPYKLKPCEHHTTGQRPPCPSYGDPPTPKCYKRCTNKKYKTSFLLDKHMTSSSYIVTSKVEEIQKEIIAHGPVEAGFTVYGDFLTYKSGVYQHITGDIEGGHAVKIIGWGVENNTKYWLVANSWNSDWGDNGFFKIRLGVDECGFESEVSAGIPLVN